MVAKAVWGVVWVSERRGDDRRKRQAKQSNVQQAKADLDRTKDDAARKIEEAKDHLEHTKSALQNLTRGS